MGQNLVIEGCAHEGDLGTLTPSFFLSPCFLVTMKYSDMCSRHSVLLYHRSRGKATT